MITTTTDINVNTEIDMLNIGRDLAENCHQLSLIIYLYGKLGAGKTTLARGFLRGLGYTGKVKSPTYALVEQYQIGEQQLFHFDLYRLKDPEELEHIGIRDYAAAKAIWLIEWPEKGEGLLPGADLNCYINAQVQARSLKIIAKTQPGADVLKTMIASKQEKQH